MAAIVSTNRIRKYPEMSRLRLVRNLVGLALTTVTSSAIAASPAHALGPIRPIADDTTGFAALIPEFQQFVQLEGQLFTNPALRRLDPNKLKLSTNSEVKVFFLNEGAGKRNDLAFSALGATTTTGMLFEDISCRNGCMLSEPDGNLNIGDWRSLGTFGRGTQFNFNLLATNFIDGLTDVYGADSSSNPDGLDHLVAFEYKGYLMLGFEDLFGPQGATGGRNEGSDRDFNDVAVVLKMPVKEADYQAVPEPSSLLGLAAVGLLATARNRRQDTPY